MISQEQETKRAEKVVERFVRRFHESYRLLAYHAALPLVLTPELLNFLRVHFLQGQVPWVAEVDLLLSDLCKQVGYELYAMDTAVRAYLVERMKHELGEERMQEAAKLLINYVKYLAQSNPYLNSKELETQQWAAMVYLGDEECKAVAKDIAEHLVEVSSNVGRGLTESAIRAELGRLAQITQELSPQLQEQSSLVEYARLVQQVLRTPKEVNPVDLHRSYQVEDVELRFPEGLLPEDLVRTVQSSRQTITSLEGFPPLQNLEFRIATISVEGETETPGGVKLQPFTFEVATIERQKGEWVINRHQQQNQYFTEDLGNGIELEMVQIPGGTFRMGAPKDEEGSNNSECPQHQVTLPSFFMGKYPITQAQWRAIASRDLKVERDLEPNPSRFQNHQESERCPVERVPWYDAVEFCARLSKQTGKEYRLPSEAEWEYTCRAETTTPFHFGQTITSELANYNANYTYGAASKGIYRRETTPVGSFGVANAFGLYDMHGNVWEWCLDDWRDNYKGAPTDGIPWFDNKDDSFSQKTGSAVLRGGSWVTFPKDCRSAARVNLLRVERDYISDVIGFRVVCAFGRSLQ